MRAIEFIVEGRGIGARDMGTTFANADGGTITLQQVVYFPPEPGAYPDHEVLQQELAKFKEAIGTDQFTMYGAATAGAKAALVSVWSDEKGEVKVFGKYAQKVVPGVPGVQWSNSEFKKGTGYGAQDKKTEVQSLDVKPGDVLGGKGIKIDSIPSALQKGLESRNVDDNIKAQMVEMTINAGRGDTTPTAGAGEHVRLHEVYTGEYAAPYVLAKNSPLINGNMRAIEDALLAPQGLTWDSFTQCVWPTSTTEKLVDSFLMAGNYKLGVSSKAKTGGGAAASVDGIMSIVKTKKDQFDPAFLKANAKFIDALETLMTLNSTDGPLQLAIKFKFITAKGAAEIKERMQSFDNNAKTLSKELQKVLKTSAPTAKGTPYAPSDMSHPGYSIGYHLMAIVSRLVGNKLNTMNPTKFFKGVLNYADLVQVYAKASKKGEDAVFSEFKVVYPPTFEGRIVIDPETNYYATAKPKGRITFKLRK